MITFRPAMQDDFAKLIDEPLPYRVRAFALENGSLLAVGGLAFQPADTVAAFLLLHPDADPQKFKIALHKAGLHVMRLARQLGIRRVVALAEKNNPAAEPWLTRCGFRPVTVGTETAWVWQDEG